LKTFWIFKKALRFCSPYILVNVFVMSGASIISLIVNIVNKAMINELVASSLMGELSSLFVGLVIVYLLLYFINHANGFLVVLGNNFYRLKVNRLFHEIFMWKSYKTPQEKFFDHKFMEKYAFVSGNTERISSYIGALTNIIFGNIGTIVGSIIIFVQYEPWLILYSALIAVGMIVQKYITKKEYELNKKQIKEQRFNDYYKEILTGKGKARELRIYKLDKFFLNKWKSVYEKLRLERLSLTLKKTDLNNGYSVIIFLFRIAAIILLIVGIYYKKYDVGTFVMLFGLIGTVSRHISHLTISIVNGTYRDVKYLNDYYDFVAPISNEDIKKLRKGLYMAKTKYPFGQFAELKADNVSFKYPNADRKAVDDVSFFIKKGEIVSILGYNGSGKTTLAKLLNGSFIPQDGIITLNGIPLSEENKEAFFWYFGNAPQEFSRFSVSIHDFVGLGRLDKMKDEVELAKAYRKAGMNDLIGGFEHRDQTILGKAYDDQGTDLSGGQWQRLIIASAYMGEPEILVFDEPTASIDPLKEMELIKDFRKNLSGKTAILISHRIGFARLADRIVMMENGRVAESGTHDELLATNGIYARIFKEQRKLYQEEVAVE